TPTNLPTYPFQRRHFWFRAPTAWAREEYLLGAAVERADDGGLLFTGTLDLDRHPWLADHVIGGRPLVPGSLFVDLALRAGLRADAPVLDELTLQTPLLLPERGTLSVQVSVGGVDEHGRRALTVHSRPGEEDPWALHATGALRQEEIAGTDGLAPAADPWPPAGADPLDVADVYRRLGALGYDYGAGLRNVTAAWQAGDTLLAEVRLGAGTDVHENTDETGGPARVDGTDGADGEPFALHPALLDAALHLLPLYGGADGVRVPFSWTGVRLAAVGATTVRVRLTPADDGSVSVLLTDLDGLPVASARSLTLRAVPADAFAPATDALYTLEWRPVATDAATSDTGTAGTVEGVPVEGIELRRVAGGRGAAVVAGEVLALVQDLLARDADSAAGPGSRLAVVTSGAVWTGPTDLDVDPAAATAWGLLRSAMSEHPDRFLLLDTDGDAASESALTAAVATALRTGESQLALRAGRLLAPRLQRLPAGTAPVGDEPADETRHEHGTALITGATGALGGLIAERLVTRHGVRHLLLVSRRGPDAPGADRLLARLRELGAHARLVACDTADRDALAALLATIPAEQPLTAVVHAAGVLDDGTIETLTPNRLTTTLTPKADAATHLHTLTQHH
ncbi:type I polyketide synthase, partial [Parafrankia sp. FMc6]|uniref:type I polyketide synthase n=1 Tax=Parafrankia soli TaxID=2599596 RepID=UPI0034D6399A